MRLVSRDCSCECVSDMDNEEEFESETHSAQDDVPEPNKDSKLCETLSNVSLHEHPPAPTADVSKPNSASKGGRAQNTQLHGSRPVTPPSPKVDAVKVRRRVMRAAAREVATTSLAPRVRTHDGSVEAALMQFTTAELLTGSNKFGCETCTKRKQAETQSGSTRGIFQMNFLACDLQSSSCRKARDCVY